LRLDFTPTCVSKAFHTIERPFEIARGAVQGKFATLAQLIVEGLQANQHPAPASSDIAAELVDVARAGLFDLLACGSNTIREAGLR